MIYGGIDASEFNVDHTEINDLKMTLGLTIETSLVAQIGQVTSWKNHSDFIKIAKEIIDNYKIKVHFLIVGDNMSENEKKYKEQLKREILKAGLEKHFTFLGFINNIKNIYSQINVLVHPAMDEPFGRVVVEAMAMEKPVVAYDCGGPKEIVLNDQTGFLIKPLDYKMIAEKVVLLLNDEKLQLQFGKAGRNRIIEKFNITEQISKMEALFDNMKLCIKY
jgi:glycosyltransferase involved in cell wall biosynthesis